MNSDKIINYSLRPSKSIERKMMLEVFKEVCTPSNSDNYQYIGFGASFFQDFKIIHRELNISTMISIEGHDTDLNIKRCQFNKPFNCIKIIPGKSYEKLPKLNWEKNSIVWLDYDRCLQNYMFQDAETCCQKAKSGGFLVLSLRREFDQKNKEEFEEEFGEKVPVSIKAEDIEPLKSHLTIREMFINKINETLLNEYSHEKEEDRLIFKQLFNFNYKDGAPMYTFGGMFIYKKEEEMFNKYKFNSYHFISPNETSTNISFPIITNKEYHELTRHLPNDKDEFLKNEEIDFIPLKHKRSYFSVYRQYPTYIEVNDI